MKLPEGEKGYKCNRCTSAFSQTGHLKAHLMMHSRESPTNATNVIMPLHIQTIKNAFDKT